MLFKLHHYRLCGVAVVLFVCFAQRAHAAASKPICGGTSSSKTIQLIQPKNPPRECVYHINAYSGQVCQLRIDFTMTLAQPSIPSPSNSLDYVQCVNDYFQVRGMRLCGVETSQHIYVPFNRTAGVTSVDMSIVLAARVGANGNLPTPMWDMMVTQLECPAGAAIRTQLAEEPIAPAESNDDVMTIEARATIKDGFFVAPPGCLQYFPQAAGAITSFNYNNGYGIYPGHMNYAICFRRNSHTQVLQLVNHYFKLGAEFSNLKFLELDNYCLPQLRTEGVNEDYLLVPQSTVEDSNIRASYFCGGSIQGDTILSNNPGPLMMIFNADGNYKEDREGGFAFTYRVL